MRRAIQLCWALGVVLVLAGVLSYSLHIRPRALRLHPGGGLVAQAFDDRSVGGVSVASVDTFSQRVRFRWALGSDLRNAYLGFLLERPDHGRFGIDPWDSLSLDWESDKGEAVRIAILVDQPGLTTAGRPLSRRYLQIEGVPPRQRGISSWALAGFRPPAWWFRENHQPLETGRQFLDRALAISIENGETVAPGASDEVRIYAVDLKAAEPSQLPTLALFLAAASLALIAWVLNRRRSVPPPQAPAAVARSLSPSPLDIPASRGDQVRTWLETHYHDPELSLESLARELALGPDATSREVKRVFQETFKGVLNRLRLQEARRLLHESDLGIAEIAYKVGYGNVSHFNRLAKETWGRTPTEERTQTRSSGGA